MKALYSNYIIDVVEANYNEQGYKWMTPNRKHYFRENEIEILDTEGKCICEILREHREAEMELAYDCYTILEMGYGWIGAFGEGESLEDIKFCPYCGKKFD